VGVGASLVDDEPAFLSVELEEPPLTARGPSGKAGVDLSTDANGASLFHVEGKADQRGVFLRLRPGYSANFWIVIPEPEVVVDSVRGEAGCTLVHRKVDTEEDLITIKDMSDVEYGT